MYVQVSHVNTIRVESCSVYYFVSVIYHELTFLFYFNILLDLENVYVQDSARIEERTEAGMKLVVLFGEGWFLRRNIYLVRGTFFFCKNFDTGRVLSKPRRCL